VPTIGNAIDAFSMMRTHRSSAFDGVEVGDGLLVIMGPV
jgi:hypothetical protein